MLKIEHLNKQYGTFYALNDLNLHIKKGELYGFVGPNGAGKTTTMKIVCGLLSADSGTVMVDGVDALNERKKVKDKIGYMPDFFGTYDNLTAMEYMEFYASIYGIQGKEAKKLCQELMALVNLEHKMDAFVDGLSRGMKQRLCLARCLVHNPELLILDEPASGLDPRARFEMKGILRNLTDMGKTILISSHILPELAEMCSSIGVIESGHMVLSGSVDNIMHNFNASKPLLIRFAYDMDKALTVLKENPLVESLSTLDNSISIGFKGNDKEQAELLEHIIHTGAGVSYFAREEGNLESLFMQITEVGGANGYEN